ncbi:uncharacterized protein LY89DRAFT_241203 [Mollisia scopiformis]|uniref:Uncharacterized protein n=1 Tax=Mollisia scopiformis TaxID=149040 RepID=A0A194WTK0_MOLSC|nr:uncharacterized protein LY89DRAFT_241203 [Mollisia scopiformis]KUJ11275.1 hypothetical protein LY89DRAFT_241203 [Mollisia scopiformis]
MSSYIINKIFPTVLLLKVCQVRERRKHSSKTPHPAFVAVVICLQVIQCSIIVQRYQLHRPHFHAYHGSSNM